MNVVAKLLKSGGFNSGDIATALKSNHLWDRGNKKVADTLKKLDYGKSTVEKAMKTAGFSNSQIKEAFDWLKW